MKEKNEKSFCITCGNALQSFAYNIEKLNDGKTSLTRLDTYDEQVDKNNYKRIFYLSNQEIVGNDLLLVNIEGKKLSVNRYTLNSKCLKVQKNISNISYEVVIPENDYEIEFKYLDNQKRNVCVFNVTSKEEVIPACSYNKYSKELKGKFKLDKSKQYVILNIE